MRHLSLSLAAALLLGAATASAADVYGLEKGTPDLKSADVLAFGPGGILFVGDTQSAAVFAIQTGDKSGTPADAKFNIDGLNVKIAEKLGGSSQDLAISDLAVNPATGNVFVAVKNGGNPALVKIDGAGDISQFSLENVPFSVASLPDAPAPGEIEVGGRKRNLRADVITDIAFVDGQLLVTGTSSGESAAAVRSFAFPFSEVEQAAALEIFHAAHGRSENYAVPRTFVPFNIGGEPNLLAGFVCTPLVRFPVADVQPGNEIKGKTVAELGNRNRPLDMIVYEQDGKNYLLLINSARGTMKISTEKIEANAGITEPVGGGGTAGQSYETIDALAGAQQLDKLSDTHAVVLVQTDSGAMDLRTVELP
ncbi:MAG: hypothetical protein JNG89_11490 [Planctomycetaceae bacterium]|nr:hypothetical protein [Planctomycetaceae bacterium]